MSNTGEAEAVNDQGLVAWIQFNRFLFLITDVFGLFSVRKYTCLMVTVLFLLCCFFKVSVLMVVVYSHVFV